MNQEGSYLPAEYAHLGNLVAMDGSLIDSVLSMEWADCRGGAKKAKAHIGFDISRGIPRKIYLSGGKEECVIGDSAHWIWNIADEHFYGACRIVDWFNIISLI